MDPTVRRSAARAGSDRAVKTAKPQAERPLRCVWGRAHHRLTALPTDANGDPGGLGRKVNPTRAAVSDVVL